MNTFTMSYADSPGNEHTAVEISHREQRLCRISREHAPDGLCIEFFEVRTALPLGDVEAALRKARQMLEGAQLAADELQQRDA